MNIKVYKQVSTYCCRLHKYLFTHKCRYICCSAILILFLIYWFSLPRHFFNKPTSTIIEDREGQLLGARIADDGQWRFPILDSIPEKYAISLVVFEDKRFYNHPGVDVLALGRALKQNLSSSKIVSGGSTISMQVIRMMRDNPPRNLLQKLIEAIQATRLEIRCSKNEILNLYASNAPMGGNVVGLSAASWRYFGREPNELSWAESATLAILPNAPSLIHPGKNREQLLTKRNRLLEKLHKEGYISAEDCSLAKYEPLPDQPLPLPLDAPHLLNRVAVKKKGQRTQTTLSKLLQQRVNYIVNNYATSYKSNHVNNIAIVVAEVESGDISAYVGNVYDPNNIHHGNRVDIITAPRSTGSILKPFLYAAMLDQGELLPNMLVADIPLQIRSFSPKNYDRGYDGVVTAHRALERSLNVPAVRMLQSYGLERFHLLLRQLGMHTITRTPDHYGLTLILGGAEGSLWDITGIYAQLARTLNHYHKLDGQYDPTDRHELNYKTSSSTLLTKNQSKVQTEKTALIQAAAIWQTFQALSEVNRPEEEASWKTFSSSRKVAWKTGTSYGNRDAWAVGVTPGYVVGVWVGNASGEGRPGLTGVNYAAPLLFEVFAQLPYSSWFAPPFDEMTKVAVCRKSGHRASYICDQIDTMWIAQAGLNSEPCPYHSIIHLSPDYKYRVGSDCMSTSEMIHVPWFVLPPAQEWYYKSKNIDYHPLPPIHPNCISTERQKQMELIYPQHNISVVLPRQLDGSTGRVVFRAAHRRGAAIIFWHIDNQYIGSSQAPHQMPVNPDVGEHKLTLVDDEGNTISEKFSIADK